MKILHRYIIKEASVFFLINLLAFTGLLLTLRLLKLTSLIINKGVSFDQIAMVFLSVIPTFLEIAIPLATLLGVMLAFARLSGDSEIVVIRSSGIGLHQLIKPVCVFGIVVGLISLYVSTQLKPWGYNQLSKSLFEITRSKSTAGLSEGIFNDLGSLTLYAEKIDHYTGELENVIIEDRRDTSSRKIISAKNGVILSDEDKQTITFNLFSGDIHEIIDKKYVLTSFNNNSLVMSPDELNDPENKQGNKRSRAMTMAELNTKEVDYLNRLNELTEKQLSDGERDKKLEEHAEISRKLNNIKIEHARRFSMPFAAFILALIAFPLGIQPPRTQKTWGAGFSASLGLGVFVIYYALLSIGVALAENGIIPAFISVWLPNIVAALLAAYALKAMSSEKWQSISQGFEQLALFLTRKRSKV